MASEHLIDPELKPALEAFPAFELNETGLAELRALLNSIEPPSLDESLAVDVRELRVPGLEGAPEIRVVAYRPRGAARPLPAILHIHGGGFVSGNPEQGDASNRRHAATLGCAVYSVDYRLAPECPHPGPVEDCYAVLKWLFANVAAEGVDPTRIGVKGESAGAGLAAAIALLARDRGEARLAFQHLQCPMLDDRTAARTDIAPSIGEFVWTRASNAFGWRSLIGAEPGGGDVSAYCAPARAVDLAGLPRTFISVGALDLFLDEDMEYARRLAHAGVPVELHVYPGCFHGFELFEPAESRVSKAAIRDSMEALSRAMFG